MQTKQKCFYLQGLLSFGQKWDMGRKQEKNLKWVGDSWNNKAPSCRLSLFSLYSPPSLLLPGCKHDAGRPHRTLLAVSLRH